MIQIDPTRTIVLAYQYGGFDDGGKPLWHPVKVSAANWIKETFPKENIWAVSIFPYLCARNSPIRDLVLPNLDKYDYVLSVDYDITITHPGLENFLKTPGDVVACKVKTDNPHSWQTKQSFHTGFWRARTEVFKAIKPPWFSYPYSADGCELLGCDCKFFADKALAAGFSVAHGGTAGHQCGSGTIAKPIGHQRWFYRTVDEGAIGPEDAP